MATNYPKRPVFAPSDAMRKLERELEAIRIEVMSISNIVDMDPKVRAILARKKAEETIERVKKSEHDFIVRKLLTERRDRKKLIHEKAKLLVRQHEATKGKRPDLVYKVRVKKDTDNAR